MVRTFLHWKWRWWSDSVFAKQNTFLRTLDLSKINLNKLMFIRVFYFFFYVSGYINLTTVAKYNQSSYIEETSQNSAPFWLVMTRKRGPTNRVVSHIATFIFQSWWSKQFVITRFVFQNFIYINDDNDIMLTISPYLYMCLYNFVFWFYSNDDYIMMWAKDKLSSFIIAITKSNPLLPM